MTVHTPQLVSLSEVMPAELALRMAKYYDREIGKPMSEIAKSVYGKWMKGHESHPVVHAFIEKYGLQAA